MGLYNETILAEPLSDFSKRTELRCIITYLNRHLMREQWDLTSHPLRIRYETTDVPPISHSVLLKALTDAPSLRLRHHRTQHLRSGHHYPIQKQTHRARFRTPRPLPISQTHHIDNQRLHPI